MGVRVICDVGYPRRCLVQHAGALLQAAPVTKADEVGLAAGGKGYGGTDITAINGQDACSARGSYIKPNIRPHTRAGAGGLLWSAKAMNLLGCWGKHAGNPTITCSHAAAQGEHSRSQPCTLRTQWEPSHPSTRTARRSHPNTLHPPATCLLNSTDRAMTMAATYCCCCCLPGSAVSPPAPPSAQAASGAAGAGSSHTSPAAMRCSSHALPTGCTS